jgi:hypothetical protein
MGGCRLGLATPTEVTWSRDILNEGERDSDLGDVALAGY